MDKLRPLLSITITELKRNPSAVIEAAQGCTVVILNRNSPTAYLVPVKTYEALLAQHNTHNRTLLADFINTLPIATSLPKDLIATQHHLPDTW
jgi:prevent-host-death family protein